MIRSTFTTLLAGFLSATTISHAAVLASWDFESIDDAPAIAGQEMNNVIPSYFTDETGNNNGLYNYSGTGYLAVQNVFGNTTLCADKQTSWDGLHTQGDLEVGGVEIGALATWTISADVCFAGSDIGAWRTVVGKDGYGAGGNNGGDTLASLFYLQKTWDNYFKVNFVDTADNRWQLQSTVTAVADTWYTMEASSDGSTLTLTISGGTNETVTLDISASSDSSLMDMQEAGMGWDTDWSVGRGMYDRGHGDKVDGYIDNVLITGVVSSLPQIQSRSPQGANASALPVLKAVIVNGTTPVDTNSVDLLLDGGSVGYDSLSFNSGTTTVSFATTEILAPLTLHTAAVAYVAGGTSITSKWTFTVVDYDTLPADWASDLSLTNSSDRGFYYRAVNHSAQTALDIWNVLPILTQLAGKAPFTDNSAPGTHGGYYYLPEDSLSTEPDVINFNINAGSATHGNFYSAAAAPLDVAEGSFLGFDNTLYPYDFVTETITYLELQPGYYTLGLNSDDSHLVFMGADPRDWFAPRFGRLGYSGSDSTTSFQIDTAGLYPIRVVQAQAGGGAGLELFTVAQDGTRTLVNDDTYGGVRAWRVSSAPRPFISWLEPDDGSVTTNETVSIEITDGDTALGAYTLTVNGSPASESSSKAGAVTTITASLSLGDNAFELVFSGKTNTFNVKKVVPPSISYVDVSHGASGNTMAWDTNTETYVEWNPAVTPETDRWEFGQYNNLDGNGGTYAQAQDWWGGSYPQDCPRLRTTVTGLVDGVYHVYAYFWNGAAQDWQIQAALADSPGGDLTAYTPGSSFNLVDLYDPNVAYADTWETGLYSSSLEVEHFVNGPVKIGQKNWRLFEADLGTVTVSGGEFTVYLDDNKYATDYNGRTVLDGIGFAPATGSGLVPEIQNVIVSSGMVTLTWTSESGATYSIVQKDALTDGAWNPVKTGISGGDPTTTDSVSVSGGGEEFLAIEVE